MTKLSDYVINFLTKQEINDIFLVSGGGMMHLLDSVGKNKKMRYISNHHEQASAIAAESYSRMTGHMGACIVTTGPGGTNAITGVAGAWLDSIPMIVISGQVKREVLSHHSKLRQMGPQEIDIARIVASITKYAVTILDPNKIRYELEKCFYLAKSGRPGPVWLDIPLDVQSSLIDESKLSSFVNPINKQSNIGKFINLTSDALMESKRPIIIAGNGIRLSNAQNLLLKFLKQTKIPILLPFGGMDLVGEDEHFFVAKFGPGGQRRGNFALQNADLIISIGASLNVASIGFEYKGFAPNAKKFVVNIDEKELNKKTLQSKKTVKINSDAKKYLEDLIEKIKNVKFSFDPKWNKELNKWNKRYPNVLPEFFEDREYVNSYVFFDTLSKILKPRDVITTGIGLDASSMYQAFRIKHGQRAYVNKNLGQMGWGLPGAIGACIGNNRKQTVCVTGDGDIQVNIHELGVISYNKLPIKIFVFSNGMYESIRFTQNNLFQGRLVGSDETSGVSAPDFKSLAKAYGIKYTRIENNSGLKNKISKVLKTKGPVICELNLSYYQKRVPKVSSYADADGVMHSKPLEDMAPFLPVKEVYENMHLFD